MTETQINKIIGALWARWYESGPNDETRGWWRTRNTMHSVCRARVRELAWHIAREHDGSAEDDEAES